MDITSTALKVIDVRGSSNAVAEISKHVDHGFSLDPDGSVRETVRKIVDDVRQRGEVAVAEYSAKFDGVAFVERENMFRVPDEKIAEALDAQPREICEALVQAAFRIQTFHETQVVGVRESVIDGVRILERSVAVAHAGAYVPGGRAVYPSTVLMTAIPARVAGVKRVSICVPPDRETGLPPQLTLAAAAIAGVDNVYAIGGAQAVAAMAFGVGMEPVDVIVGPGNRYVAIAKQLVAGTVGVPSAFAGPSEVVVVADESVAPRLAALDICVQAEHGPDGLAWLICTSSEVAAAVMSEIDVIVASADRKSDLVATLQSNGRCVVCDNDVDTIVGIVDLVAPEHLELLCANSDELARRISNAGAIFVGRNGTAAMGDYLAGPSHVLPTAGTARFASALGVRDFVKEMHIVDIDDDAMTNLAVPVAVLARAEGLPIHAESAEARNELPSQASARAKPSRIPASRFTQGMAGGYHSPQVDAQVRLNTNESPLGPPAEWLAEFRSAVSKVDLNRYPDLDCTDLRAAIAAHHGVDIAKVWVGKGSNELTQMLCMAYGGPGRRAVTFEPTFQVHATIVRTSGTEHVAIPRTQDFAIRTESLATDLRRISPAITFVCTPNNPTGIIDPESTVRTIIDAAPGLVLIDEAYAPFTSADWIAAARPFDHVLVSRTFSKLFSLAALRLGYVIADPEIIHALRSVTLPYHLDAITQAAGVLAMQHADMFQARAAEIQRERDRVAFQMQQLGCEVWPSAANFVLFRPTSAHSMLGLGTAEATIAATSTWSDLLAESVLVRNTSGWDGLSGCLRVTIGTQEENDKFLQALRASVERRTS